jgi:uncharacterized damage-inducible protein DinB
MAESSARLDIVPIWSRLNNDLIALVDHVPDDRLEWSPKPELWGFRRVFLHVAEAREQWMKRAINDGVPDIVDEGVTGKEAIRDALRGTWQRIERTFGDQAKVDATYVDRWRRERIEYTGHWVAYHLLEHDIHHRADMLLYMTLLGIETPQVWTA